MIRIGELVRPHGLRGWVAVTLDDPKSRTLLSVSHVWLEQKQPAPGMVRRRYDVQTATSGRSGQVLLGLAGVTTCEAAELLRGTVVLVEESQIPALSPGEFWQRDLLGLTAVDERGTTLGRVTEVVDTAEVPVLVVMSGSEELFVPFAAPYVKRVELATKTIVVSPPGVLP